MGHFDLVEKGFYIRLLPFDHGQNRSIRLILYKSGDETARGEAVGTVSKANPLDRSVKNRG
ncbi:MAG: hypothetical protein ACI9QL_003215 [Candidatus Omnitrophota bacterium]|jgi:hypothetical protein